MIVEKVLSFLNPQAYAQCDAGNGVDLGDCFSLGAGSNQAVKDVYSKPADIVNILVPNLFILGGILFFIMILVSGFKFISGSTKGKDEAKTIMTVAATGLIVMFSAYWIVQIVKLMTGQTDIF